MDSARTALLLPATLLLLSGVALQAGESKIVLREYLNQQWTKELLSYAFSAPKGACHPGSVTLTGPQGQGVAVQLSEVELWPGTQTVKSAKLSFIANLAPLATDTYTVRYGDKPTAVESPAADLQVLRGRGQVRITTEQFGARLLLGEQTYAEPAAATEVPGPVVALRLGDGTWFGGSAMYGPTKLKGYAAKLTDAGPVFARVAIRYTYESGNTFDLSLQVAAGDNTIRCETQVAQHQSADGFRWVLSRGLPPLVFQVQDEGREDRPCFTKGYGTGFASEWAEIPLQDYVAPPGQPAGLVTQLTPWEDWFTSFSQTRIRLKLEGMQRELQIRSLDPGAWVEPRTVEEIFAAEEVADPAKGMWADWYRKMLPVMRGAAGEAYLQVNAAQGLRKWTLSDCLSVPGVAGQCHSRKYKSERRFPRETRPLVGYRLDEVKDYVLAWPGDEQTHPRLFISREQLRERWERKDADPQLLATLLRNGSVPSAEAVVTDGEPDWSGIPALGAYLLSGGSGEVAEKTQLAARLRQALSYDLWGTQFARAGTAAPLLYDGVIDSLLITDEERPALQAQMAYFGYRLADPAVWSAERGYASNCTNMTVTWELSRGLVACTIPEHPMARVWYAKAERLMEAMLTHMVGPAGEWPEAMGDHGRHSVNMLLSFALASTSSGLHDYVNDPRMKRLILYWAKLATPRDPRPRGLAGATPNRRYCPAMGRDCIGFALGTCGAMARATRDTDPDYSAVLQWSWLEEGANESLVHLGGFDYLACDKRLPARQPQWSSEVFPCVGAILRHGLGTSDEHQVTLYSGDHFGSFYPGHTGSLPSIFAYGIPVAGSFPGSYENQDELLLCHVTLARPVGAIEERTAVYGYHGSPRDANVYNWPDDERARFGEHGGLSNVSSFATLPRQDYVAVDVARHYPRSQRLLWLTTLPEWPEVVRRGEPPVDWRRQVLFLKADDPGEAGNYLLLRDSVKGDQPTMWQMWNVSETLDTPDKVRDVDAVLANKPGSKILPARELRGDRFTALGQLGVDVEYYIATPTDTPRHTLRWGTEFVHNVTNRLQQPEYQDLLHLQLWGDGAYYVAFYPRKRDWPAPVFSTLGNGLIIKVAGDFGTDYGFLSALEAAASGEGASFTGTAGSVQDRTAGLVLSLGGKGEVRYRDYGLAAAFAASLRVGEKEVTVEFPEKVIEGDKTMEPMIPFPGGTVTVSVPGEWALAKPLPGVTLTKTAAGWALSVPGELRAVTLVKHG